MFFSYFLNALRFLFVFAGCLLTVTLTILGVIYSIHHEAFIGLSPVTSEAETGITVSEIFTPEEDQSTQPTISPVDDEEDETNKRRPLYVFALDVSGSLARQSVDDNYRDLFESIHTAAYPPNVLEKDRKLCNLSGENVTKWHLARSKICHILRNVEPGALVALWRFGTKAEPIGRYDFNLNGKDVPLELGMAQNAIMAEKLSKDKDSLYWRTSFQNLLGAWYESYFSKGNLNQIGVVHFIVVSDFVQDQGENRDLWAFSAYEIKNRVEQFNRQWGVMFHLVPLTGGLSEQRSVIPILSMSLEWYKYNTFPLQTPDPSRHSEQFYSFQNSNKALEFYYPAGGRRVQPRRIVLSEKTTNANLELRLIQNGYGGPGENLRLRISSCKAKDACPFRPAERYPEWDSEIISAGQTVRMKIDGSEGLLCIEPLSMPRTPYPEYRLAVAVLSKRLEGIHRDQLGERKTFVSRIEFTPFLPDSVATVWRTSWWAMWIIGGLTLVAALGMAWWHKRREAKLSQRTGKARPVTDRVVPG